MTYKRKQITFWLSMMSLLSLVLCLINPYKFLGYLDYDEVLEFWFFFSLPLIVNLIHYAVFREEKNDKQDSKED